MGNRVEETRTKLKNNGTQIQKEFSYDTNTLNQYVDRYVSLDITEVEEELGEEVSMELE
jgi:hypothetical protein